MTMFLKDGHTSLISKMLGLQFRSWCLSSSSWAHLWCPLPEPCSYHFTHLLLLLRNSLLTLLPCPFLIFRPFLWLPFLQRKLTFRDTVDQFWSILHLVHLDSFRKASARPHTLCALPWLSSAVPFSMEWKVCRGKRARWPRALTPPPSSNMAPRIPHSIGPRQLLEEVSAASLGLFSKGQFTRLGVGWRARDSCLWREWTEWRMDKWTGVSTHMHRRFLGSQGSAFPGVSMSMFSGRILRALGI